MQEFDSCCLEAVSKVLLASAARALDLLYLESGHEDFLLLLIGRVAGDVWMLQDGFS
jgi:hypothetical protein